MYSNDSALRRAVLAWVAALAWMAAECAHSAVAAQSAALPDWNGVWVIENSFMDKQDGTFLATPGRFDPKAAAAKRNEPAYKGEYAKKYQAKLQAEADGTPVDDMGAMCLPQGMPAFWGGPYAFEILQTPKQINIYQEWNEQTRRVYLNERKQPADLDPTYNGHSIGHWEAGVLVVNTVAIREDTRMHAGAGPHSDAMYITERFRSKGPDRLEVTMIVNDEKALSQPWVNVFVLHRKHGMEIMEYVCAENNRNPINENGVTETLLRK